MKIIKFDSENDLKIGDIFFSNNGSIITINNIAYDTVTKNKSIVSIIFQASIFTDASLRSHAQLKYYLSSLDGSVRFTISSIPTQYIGRIIYMDSKLFYVVRLENEEEKKFFKRLCNKHLLPF